VIRGGRPYNQVKRDGGSKLSTQKVIESITYMSEGRKRGERKKGKK